MEHPPQNPPARPLPPVAGLDVARLGALLDDLRIGLALLDSALRYRYVNRHLAVLNGVDGDAHLGRPIEDVVPEVAPVARATFEAVLAAGVPHHGFNAQGGTNARPGALQPWEYNLYPLADGGDPLLLALVRDATVEHRAERERDEAIALLQSLFDNAPVGLGIFDRDLRFDRLNEALAEINGVDAAAHLGRTVAEVLPEMDPSVMEQMRRVLETGRPVQGTTATGRTPADPERDRHWRVAYYPVNGQDGRPFGVGAIAEEITGEVELRAAQERLRAEVDQQRQLLEDVVRRTPAAIALVWGPEHRYRLINDAYLEITPARGELVGRCVADVFPEASEAAALLDEIRRTGRPAAQDDFAVPFAGEGSLRGQRFYRFTMDPIGARDGTSEGVLMVAVEVTEEVRRREQLRAQLDLEREIVHQLQEALLPERLPSVPGLALAACYEPAGREAAVGGDFYDVFRIGEGDWIAVLGDVCGKGSKAAAATAMFRYMVRAEARHDPRPAALLAAMNAEAVAGDGEDGDGDGDVLCTAICARLTAGPDGWTVTLATAGHPPAIVRRAPAPATLLSATGPLIGLDRSSRFTETQTRLGPGDTLVLYTDGVLEGQAPATILRPDDVARTVDGLPSEPPALVAGVADLARGPRVPRDDVAVLAVQVTG